MRIVIYPYKMSSGSSKRLAEALRGLGHKVVRVFADRNYVPHTDDYVINWGSSKVPNWDAFAIKCNAPHLVGLASNKLRTFSTLLREEVEVPIYTGMKEVASMWLQNNIKVFARTTLTSHSGRGIVVMSNAVELVDAPLYTAEFKKTNEYRIHIFDSSVLDSQEKRKRGGTGSRVDHDIWNHGNDFVFCRENLDVPYAVHDAALRAVEALGLTFGAVDVGYDRATQKVVVFEVNTAPGIKGQTLTKYVEKIHACAI